MRRTTLISLTRFQAGWLLLGCASSQTVPASARGPVPVEEARSPALIPGDPRIDGTRLQLGRTRYLWTTSRDGEERPAGTLVEELTVQRVAGRATLRRVAVVVRGNQTLVDSTVSEATTLAPISHQSYQPSRIVRLTFAGRRVSGVTEPRAPVPVESGRTLDTVYATSMFDSGNWDLVVRSLPLRPGLAIQYLAFDVDHGGPQVYSARVVDAEPLGGRFTWKVQVALGPERTATAWIDQRTRDLVRVETDLAPGVRLRQERESPRGTGAQAQSRGTGPR